MMIRHLPIILIFSITSLSILSCQKENDVSGLVYLTFESEDTSRDITINFFMKSKISNGKVHYDSVSRKGNLDKYSFSKTAKFTDVFGTVDNLMQARLNDLQPGTTYYFTISYDDDEVFSKEFKFRTLPEDSSEIRLLQGGDMGTTQKVVEVAEPMISEEPHVILIGGDIAYANGKVQRFGRWVDWLQMMEQLMTTPRGFLVPLILAVGNHEVNSFEGLPEERAPFYFKLFPQNGTTPYFSRKLGKDAVLFVLDSGHVVSHGGAQTEWLEAKLQEHEDIPLKLALYHVPLFPSHRDYDEELSEEGREHWLPLFDAFDLTLAFENHDHTFKRSKPLTMKGVESGGTLFVGDGCWAKGPRSPDPDRWYLEKVGRDHHVWMASLFEKSIRVRATGEEAEVFDHFQLDEFGTLTELPY